MTSRSRPEYAFGRALAALRDASGMTQEKLAERAGLGQGHICKLELGYRTPTLETIRCVAIALNIKASELVALSERVQSEGSNATNFLTTKEREETPCH